MASDKQVAPIDPTSAPNGESHDVPPRIDQEAMSEELEQLRVTCQELEGRIADMVPLPTGPDDHDGRGALLAALGWPASPADYAIEAPHAAITSDERINERLHAAGFTQEQAQLVYDLGAEYLLAVVSDVVAETQARQQIERLAGHFGGDQAWRHVSRQLRAWGATHLEPDVFEALASSFDGIVAMHQMMRASEPAVVEEGEGGAVPLSEDVLNEMVRDPRYWRDRDPAFVARVTEGFKRLYG